MEAPLNAVGSVVVHPVGKIPQWEILPSDFAGKPFDYERDPALRFVERCKGNPADPPEKKVANFSDTATWTGSCLFAFCIKQSKAGVAIHAASPLAPEFLAKPGVARAIMEVALDQSARDKDEFLTRHFVESGGYRDGLQAFFDAGEELGVSVRLGNEQLPYPRIDYAKNPKTEKEKPCPRLREKVDPLCVVIDTGGRTVDPSRKRQRNRPSRRRIAPRRDEPPSSGHGEEGEEYEEEIDQGNIPINEAHHSVDHQQQPTRYSEESAMFADIPAPVALQPVTQPAFIVHLTRIDLWRKAPIASPIIPTTIPLLALSAPITRFI